MLRDEVKSPLSEKLLSEASAGVFLDDIVNIERETVKMFDICVPDGHAFVGNVFINHNSQGMTLDKVKVYLASCFEAGQAYVALSRVRTLAGLYIGDFASGCIRANRVARDFYNKLNKVA